MVGIGCGGDDGHRPAHGSKGAGEVVGTAQMAGQDGNGKLPALVQHHHGGVGCLAFAVGRDGPHGDACSPHKNQCVALCKLLRCPVGKLHAAHSAEVYAAGICRAELFRKGKAFFGKGQIRPGHWSVPRRNSVVKAGSYSLLRS